MRQRTRSLASATGITFDLTTIRNTRLHAIEAIGLAGTGNNTLRLTALEVLNLSSTSNTLRVTGNARDSLVLADAGWIDGGTTGGIRTLTKGRATVQLSEAVVVAVNGTAGASSLVGTAGRESIAGLGGADTLSGGDDSDWLNGGIGNDSLDGGLANETLTGGSGDDTFLFEFSGNTAGDVVTDFACTNVAGGDVLRFVGFGTGGTVTLLTGNTWQVAGSAGLAQITLVGVTALGSGYFVFG